MLLPLLPVKQGRNYEAIPRKIYSSDLSTIDHLALRSCRSWNYLQ
jgi:hypothetical protein